MMSLTTKPWNDPSLGENITSISTEQPFNKYARFYPNIDAFRSLPPWKMDLIMSLIYLSGIIANSLLLTYLLYYKRYKSPIFCVILSLCVADLCTSIATILWIRVDPFMRVPTWMCRIVVAMLIGGQFGSTYHIIIFAALRFYQLVYPLASRAKLTVSLLSRICLALWVADAIQSFTLIVFYEIVEIDYLNEKLSICLPKRSTFAANIWMAVAWGVLPFLTTCGLHISKHIILLCKTSDSVAMTAHSSTKQQNRKQTDSRALALVLGLYFITILPSMVQYGRNIFFTIPRTQFEWKVSKMAQLISFMNSSLNPWIYMLASESVRSDIRKMCIREMK